ncbi:e9imm peptide [Kitasatospora sp. NPDC057500]|uniref:e9imm peptide n=1 Tax=Kitasatospora sp. NPDC057500 TaxID=3346151 RepID=UPI00368E37D5
MTVLKIMGTDRTDEAWPSRMLETFDRALGCPGRCVGDLVFRPRGPGPTATDVVGQALVHRPFAR